VRRDGTSKGHVDVGQTTLLDLFGGRRMTLEKLELNLDLELMAFVASGRGLGGPEPLGAIPLWGLCYCFP